jgi:hypothetical protein
VIGVATTARFFAIGLRDAENGALSDGSTVTGDLLGGAGLAVGVPIFGDGDCCPFTGALLLAPELRRTSIRRAATDWRSRALLAQGRSVLVGALSPPGDFLAGLGKKGL